VPLKLDSTAPKISLDKFMANETRFGILKNVAPARAAELAVQAQDQVRKHYAIYQQLAAPPGGNGNGHPVPAVKPQPSTPASS
jgi:pyruvate-ferredoxin/flavodoxin oxidoreductase